MYYHLIENTQREGKSVYRLVKSYKRWSDLVRYVRRHGKPIWIYGSNNNFLVTNGGTFGGHQCQFWNSGANFQVTYMPVLPIVN